VDMDPSGPARESESDAECVVWRQAQKMTQDLEKFTKSLDQARQVSKPGSHSRPCQYPIKFSWRGCCGSVAGATDQGSAEQEYLWLYEKYPSSAPLLSSYASFCDHVLNDHRKADQLRQQASVMETYGRIDEITVEEAESEEESPGNEVTNGVTGGDNKSVSSGDNSEPYRVQMARYMQSWSHLIMSRDADMLRVLEWRVKGTICFLVMLSLASFIVTDLVLFNDVASLLSPTFPFGFLLAPSRL
jgi:hypothetical protein